MAKRQSKKAKSTEPVVEAKKEILEVKPLEEVKSDVIPLEDIKLREPEIVAPPDVDPEQTPLVEQVSQEGVEQEKLPGVPEVDESADDAEEVRFGEDKIKDAYQEENPGGSRDQMAINPEFQHGRKSEWPRG